MRGLYNCHRTLKLNSWICHRYSQTKTQQISLVAHKYTCKYTCKYRKL